jgi:hypothetical protein
VNQYVLLRRLRGPIMLLIFGVTAILDEYTGIHYRQSWPLYIIAWGILKLAENALLARNPPAPPAPYPGYPPASGTGFGPWPDAPAASASEPPASTTAIVRSPGEEAR